MFGISYSVWTNVCEMYFSLQNKTKKSYLQWFPFYKLSDDDKEILLSKDFYDRYIRTGSFIMFPRYMHQSENYIQKGDGSFRDASLVSPLLYLVLQAIGKEISNLYEAQRPYEFTAYYAGNYKTMRPNYKLDYDDFFKEINTSIEDYHYFIKTDISSFFSNINVNLLVSRIDEICNARKQEISHTKLLLYKELLAYCGDGRFPLIENSLACCILYKRKKAHPQLNRTQRGYALYLK